MRSSKAGLMAAALLMASRISADVMLPERRKILVEDSPPQPPAKPRNHPKASVPGSLRRKMAREAKQKEAHSDGE